jgi:glutamyl-tRNA synthetase
MVTGETQTPSIDLVLELLGREETVDRINNQITNFPT